MEREQLTRYLDETLETARFKDYCPNGLQVEGRSSIRRLVAGVSASQALLDAALAADADAVLVHHGYFWKSEERPITGLRRRRLATLIKHDINLFAYHLPLDAHPELGNNAQLAKRFGWRCEGTFGEQAIGYFGRPAASERLDALAARLAAGLERTPQVIGDAAQPINRLAWCSGGAQDWFEAAIALGVDAFISGEISEPCVHLARESGVAYLAIGHHASERYGVAALAEHLRERFALDCRFIDIDNPV